MTYVDTSALIKRFVAEPGSALLHRLVAHAGPVATTTIAYAEVYAGLTRKRWEGGLAPDQYARACEQFEQDWHAYVRVDLHDEILVLARDLIRRHRLRGFDAIHLASAVSLARAVGEPLAFAAADERLLRAASAERLRPLNVETAQRPS